MYYLYCSVVFVLVLNLILATPAYAYLDPNAGGFFLQVVVPIVFGTAATITLMWRRVIGRIKRSITRLAGRKNISPSDK